MCSPCRKENGEEGEGPGAEDGQSHQRGTLTWEGPGENYHPPALMKTNHLNGELVIKGRHKIINLIT